MSEAERTRLRLDRVYFPVTALGPGRRLGIWVQGCPLACAGCMSRHTWDPAGGVGADVEQLRALWDAARSRGADGITISGGEPLAQPEALGAFLGDLERGGADVLVYTGYELDELSPAQLRAIDTVDVLVTGRYLINRPTTLVWRGSANQQMHLRTEQGRSRYQQYVDHVAERPPVQIVSSPDGTIWWAGVPRPGGLAELELSLRTHGASVQETSWRRVRTEESASRAD